MKNLFYLLLSFVFLSACGEKRPINPSLDLGEANLLPKPVSAVATGLSFAAHGELDVFTEGEGSFTQAAAALDRVFEPVGGFFTAAADAPRPDWGYIQLSLSAADSLGREGYVLDIDADKIHISAGTEVGLFYGIQTLRQLRPLSSETDTISLDTLYIPSGKIYDKPNYSWRGAMLDVSRHFFTVKEVKRVIDYLAAYKMNRLHLHLADDQGWRIEIKGWPDLTAIGGKTEVGGGEGGFFTQKDYTEIVKYAEERFITIIPEIDMPGHTNAALASYPVLNCDGKATKLYTGMRVGFSSLCLDKDTTYAFLNDVIGQISALTPGAYFHIGGDEAEATKEKDYIKFIERVEKIVRKHGKTMIGWDDITAAELSPESIAQHWQKEENAKKAVAQNMKIIMSPARKAYLDMKYDSNSVHGLRWAGYIPLDTAYAWNAATFIEGVSKENILGIEAPLWSETISNLDEAEYLLFPRLSAYAELGWTQDSLTSLSDYRARVQRERAKWDIWGVDYFKEW